MSHIPPPPARSRHSPSDSKNVTKPKSQAHPLPPNPLHHQGFIKQQVKSANNAALHTQYPQNGYASQRYPHGNAAAHLNAITQPYSTTSGASTSSSAASGSSSMYSALSSSSTQPSPATSSTSSMSSSLRTPPDFLMHGTISLTKIDRPRKVYMSIEEIDERLKLIDTLTSDLTPNLPLAPGSRRPEEKASVKKSDSARSSAPNAIAPKPQLLRASMSPVKANEEKSSSSVARPRKRASNVHDELPSFRKKVKAEVAPSRLKNEPDSGTDDAKPSTRLQPSPSPSKTIQASPSKSAVASPKRQWNRELFGTTAAAYREIGRGLKHSADRQRALSGSHRDSDSQSMTSFEFTEAILCFAYAFWCDEAGSADPRSCIASNWYGLMELLDNARKRHDKCGHVALSGLCRFIEALILQRLANGEKKTVQEQLSSMAAAELEGEALPLSLPQLSASMSKALVNEETSGQLLNQARGMLSQEVLSRDFPEVWAASSLGRSTLKAKDMDPASVEASGHPASDGLQGQWSWPMDSTVTIPHVVCFGRALLREGARRLSLPYLISSPPS